MDARLSFRLPYQVPSFPASLTRFDSLLSQRSVWELEATWTLRVRRSSLAALLLRDTQRRRLWGSSVWG